MNILKINNGKVELRNDNGSLISIIGNGYAVNVDINDDGNNNPYFNNNSPGEG